MDGIYCQGFADRDSLIGELTMKAKRLETENAKLRALCAAVRKISATGTTEDLCRIVGMIDAEAGRGEGAK